MGRRTRDYHGGVILPPLGYTVQPDVRVSLRWPRISGPSERDEKKKDKKADGNPKTGHAPRAAQLTSRCVISLSISLLCLKESLLLFFKACWNDAVMISGIRISTDMRIVPDSVAMLE